MAEDSHYRVVEYWPNKDLRILFTVPRTPETDAMTDEELIARHGTRIEKAEQQRQQEERHIRAVGE